MTFTMQYDETSQVQRDMAKNFAEDGYEPGTWRTFQWLLRRGETLVDVGAHVGTFACLAAHLVGPSGQVLAYEPDNANRRQLIRNRTINKFAHIAVRPEAVSDTSGREVFYRCADNDGGHALWDPALSPANIQTKLRPHHRVVSTVTLDEQGPPQCRLLKIDTEGAEARVIAGASRWILKTRPAIIAEINAAGLHHMLSSEVELRDMIRRLDYDEYGIQDAPPWYIPVRKGYTCQPMGVVNGQRVAYVFNMLWIPREWPEAKELKERK